MRYLLAAILALVALPSYAQQATLQSPESVTKLVVSDVHLSRDGGHVTVEFRTNADEPKRQRTFGVATSELASFITAIDTARASETGGVARRFNFRVLGWLADNGKLVNDSGQPLPVTLAP